MLYRGWGKSNRSIFDGDAVKKTMSKEFDLLIAILWGYYFATLASSKESCSDIDIVELKSSHLFPRVTKDSRALLLLSLLLLLPTRDELGTANVIELNSTRISPRSAKDSGAL